MLAPCLQQRTWLGQIASTGWARRAQGGTAWTCLPPRKFHLSSRGGGSPPFFCFKVSDGAPRGGAKKKWWARRAQVGSVRTSRPPHKFYLSESPRAFVGGRSRGGGASNRRRGTAKSQGLEPIQQGGGGSPPGGATAGPSLYQRRRADYVCGPPAWWPGQRAQGGSARTSRPPVQVLSLKDIGRILMQCERVLICMYVGV